jgi:hypothetical protein
LRAIAATAQPIPFTGALAQDRFGKPLGRPADTTKLSRVRAGDIVVRLSANPPIIHVETPRGEPVQRVR